MNLLKKDFETLKFLKKQKMKFVLILFTILASSSMIVRCDFVEELLAEQNRLRATHNAPVLQLDRELSRKADVIAKQAAEKGGFQDINKTLLQNTNTEMICSSFNEGNVFGKPEDIAQAWYYITRIQAIRLKNSGFKKYMIS